MIAGIPSLTAEFVCLFRAREARRPVERRILDDQQAQHLLGGALKPLVTSRFRSVDKMLNGMAPGLPTTIVCRHRFLDDHLRQELAAGAEQVLILGAGLDARALRFADELHGRPVFEVDFPATLARKKNQLKAMGPIPEHLEQVGCDFSSESFVDALKRSPRWQAQKKTVVIWEGVTMYLERAAVRRTLDDLKSVCAPGSSLGLDFFFLVDGRDLKSKARRLLPHALGLIGEPVLFPLHPQDAPPFLQAAGWTVVDAIDPASMVDRYVKDGRRVAPSFHVAWTRLG